MGVKGHTSNEALELEGSIVALGRFPPITPAPPWDGSEGLRSDLCPRSCFLVRTEQDGRDALLSEFKSLLSLNCFDCYS